MKQLDYERVAVDYVHYRDFGHSGGEAWGGSRQGLEEGLPDPRAAYRSASGEGRQDRASGCRSQADASPTGSYGSQDARMCATIYEGWDKAERKAVWFSKSCQGLLGREGRPVRGLEDVFPVSQATVRHAVQ